jgi:putative transposase
LANFDELVIRVGETLSPAWRGGRRRLGLDVLARSRIRVLPTIEGEVVTNTYIALSA